MEHIVSRQRDFFNSGKTRDVSFRKKQLKKLKRLLHENEDRLVNAIREDFHKPIFESYATELFILHQEIDHLLRHLDQWSKPRKAKNTLINFPSKNYIYPEPYGVSMVIGAWNYPLQLVLNPAFGALAAGNTVLLKPSEIASKTSSAVANIINKNFDPGFLCAVEGGAETTQKLLDQPLDYIFFTGSKRVGKIIMKAAAEQLTPLTLELGGKSPAIIDETVDLSLAARRIAWGKFINAGQTCVSPDYVYIREPLRDEFCERMREEVLAFYGNDASLSPDFARIINDKHFDRITGLMEADKIEFGGDTDPDSRYIEPTIMTNVDWDDDIMREEIFGPVLPVLTYTNIEEAISTVKGKPSPLALYLFSKDSSLQERIINEIPFGGGCINDTVAHLGNLDLPFGGIGSSGFGKYHGRKSFQTFSHQKSIMKKGTWLDIPLRYPPYDGNLKWLKKLLKII